MTIRCLLITLLCGFLCPPASAQEPRYEPLLAPGYYIVVAAYRGPRLDYAQRFATKISTNDRHAQYGYDGLRKWYYVYLDYYTNFDESIKEMLKTRHNGGFDDAWVRIMKTQPGYENVNLLVENRAVDSPAEVKAKEEAKPVDIAIAVISPPDSAKKPAFVPIENPSADPVYRPQILKNTPVFISLYNPTKNSIVQGDVEVVDLDHSKLITKVKGNDYVTLPDPKNASGKLLLISSSFGYRKEQHEINYKSTEQDTLQPYISLMGNYYMIKFDMIRLHQGDIEPLYNVYFYNDAAVMLPESKYELNSLLQMMQDNLNYKVMLHGHTNGNAHGKLITMGETKNFFELSSDVKHGTGSAKDLSRERAKVIRDWLIANGVAPDRMQVKAWGGSRMIHDKNSPNARKNVRVEVEVLQE